MFQRPSFKHRKKKHEVLNLIPILDSVFILIFYLLMSAQFFKVFEIGSQLPILSESATPPKQKEKLNLTIEIQKSFVKVLGFGGKIERRFTYDDDAGLKLLNDYLNRLKKKYPDENDVVIRPAEIIPYDKVVKVVDYIRQDFSGLSEDVLFEQLIFAGLDNEDGS